MTSSLWLFGLLLGMRHALEPDHLAAVSTLVVEQRRVGSGVVLGSLWGLGHTLALLIVATLLALVGAAMPQRLAMAFELAVALMLIGIGCRSMTRGMRRPAPGVPRDHVHANRRQGQHPWIFARRSLLVGSVHGLAGSGALTALVAGRLSSTPERLFTVGLFGLGSVMGMSALSGVAGWPLARLGRNPSVARVLMTGTGLLAFVLGIIWGLPLIRPLLS